MEINLTDNNNAINIAKVIGNEPISIRFQEGDKDNVLRIAWYSTGKRKYTEFVLSPDGLLEIIRK